MLKYPLRIWFCTFAMLTSVATGASAQGEFSAFSYDSVSPIHSIGFAGTKGWGFWNMGDLPIVITQIGVFDDGGDGLFTAHEIGLWGKDGMLVSATIPTGTAAALIDGYRYVSIDPILMPPHTFDRFKIAAHYEINDADDQLAPVLRNTHATGLVIDTGGGYAGLGSGLPTPNTYLGANEFRNAVFCWEPNFRYAVVPEPSAGYLLAGALGAIVWHRQRAWRRRSPDCGPTLPD